MKKEQKHITEEQIMSYLLGEASMEQNSQMEFWLAHSEANKQYFEQIEELWINTEKINPKPIVVNIDAAWKNVSEQIEQKNTKKVVFFTNKNIVIKSFTIAASVILLVGLFLIFNKKSPQMLSISSSTEILIDTISDGSIISLNKNSKLTFPEEFSKNKRIVKLEGEAFFDIKRNETKPFIIEANGAYIQVLGTSFNVRTDTVSKEVIVYVKTGKVRLYFIDNNNDTSDTYLTAGEKGFINKQRGKAAKDTVNNTKEQANEIFWFNKILIFDDTKLADVVNILEKKYKVTIIIADHSLKNEILNTSFENESIEQILEIISITFNASFSKENNTFTLQHENN